MFGPPQDVEGECNARLFLGDDYGDNTTTFRCKLAPEHEGLHREEFRRDGKPIVVTWEDDERRTERDPEYDADVLDEEAPV